MSKRKKISIIGAGNVGATCAHGILSKELGNVVLLDIVEGIPQGKALDLLQAAPLSGHDCNIMGTNDYADTKDSDIVIITAGIARKEGMTRIDLLKTNAKITIDVAENIAKYSPNAVVICVTNPVNVISYLTLKAVGFDSKKVMGVAALLDTARFRTFVALELGFSFEDITSLVLGGHGEKMVPLVGYTYASGIPIEKLISSDRLNAILNRAHHGGEEILNYLKTGSSYYATAAAVIEITEAILKDKKRILPIDAYLQGEFGEEDIYAGVPAVIGASGVEKIIEIDLNEKDKVALKESIQAVRDLIKSLNI